MFLIIYNEKIDKFNTENNAEFTKGSFIMLASSKTDLLLLTKVDVLRPMLLKIYGTK